MNSLKEKLLALGIQKRNKELDLTWQEIADQYGGEIFNDGEILRSWVKNQILRKNKNNETDQINEHKETFEIHNDGSQSSSRLIRLSAEQKKNPTFLLEAHGFDPDAWELINAKASEWTGYSKQDGQFPQYSSKITVKPKTSRFTYEKLIKSIKELKPFDIELSKLQSPDKRLLEIPLFDAHFGVSNYEYYKNTQNKIYTKICSRRWEEILFIIGQDMLHNDDFRGRTSNSTVIEQVDMEMAWNDCLQFYEPLIKESVKFANNVKIMYAKGNHDETMSWAFVQLLKAKFPNLEYDDSFIERKAHVFGDNFIGITHGDKARKNLHNIFPVEFPEQWAKARNREIHIGHIHIEDGKDWFGMMVRTLSTRNKTDKWHRDQGYVGGHKRFMLFEYSEEELESIHYV